MKKGLVEIDLLVSLTLFIIFIIVVSLTIANNFTNYKKDVDEDIFSAKTANIMNFILFSPGQPVDWNENVLLLDELGFSYYHDERAYPNLIDFEKISAGQTVSNTKLLELLDVRDVKILFEDLDLGLNYTIGAESIRKKVISLDRIVAIRYSDTNISKARMTATIWD